MNPSDHIIELTSYRVDVDLIKRIENYLFNDVPKNILKVEPNLIKKNYQLKIKDSLGTTIYDEISLYKHQFPNDVIEVQLELKKVGDNDLGLLIVFSELWQNCKIEIEVGSKNSRDDLTTILRNLDEILDFNKTINNWFFGKKYRGVYFLYSLIISLLLSIIYYEPKSIISGISFSLFIIILLWGTLGSFMHPYTEFDCRKNKRKKRIRNWFYGVFFTFLISDIFFLYYLKRFLPLF